VLSNNSELRERLQAITDSCSGQNDLQKQVGLIVALYASHPHSISPIGEAQPGKPETYRFNCHEYAFDLRGSSEIKKIAVQYHSIFPGRDYVAWLIENVLTEVTISEARDGDFVVYFSNDQIMHTGVWTSSKVRSKWGLAHLWEHGLYEVPASYGNTVRFFRKLAREQCIAAFVQYAEGRLGHPLS
jgi:hypothetical protein